MFGQMIFGFLKLIFEQIYLNAPDFEYSIFADDTVKQKLVSADGTVGFGWNRPSKFSMKRWGFYPADVLQFVK